jgi:LysR family cys regulon transcriptional activator
VPRSYALALVEFIAPQLDRRDLQRALNGDAPAQWPVAPFWSEIASQGKVAKVAA